MLMPVMGDAQESAVPDIGDTPGTDRVDVVQVAGLDPAVLADDEAVMRLAREKGIELQPGAGPGKAKTECGLHR